jgi:F-type H+-transporting ATPase subunit delta
LRDTIVAGRYAHGLFILTEKRGETARALEDLKGLLEALKPGTRVGRLLATPEVGLPEKRAALARALEGRVARTVAVFVDLLLRKKRLNEFATIVAEFEARVEKAQGIQRARVVSATPLTKAELDRLHRELERVTRGRIRLTAAQDPALVGGALVRIGDRVIDRSVRTLLDAITRQLSEASV